MRNPKNTCLPMLITPVINVGARGRRIPRGSNPGSVGNFGAIESACTRVDSIASKLSMLAVLRLFLVLVVPGCSLWGPGIARGLRTLALGAGAFLALFPPLSHAGYWSDGSCWPTKALAAEAYVSSVSKHQPFFSAEVLGSSVVYSWGVVRNYCLVGYLPSGEFSNVSCTPSVSGRFGAAAMTGGVLQTSTGTSYIATGFNPVPCDSLASDSEQVSAVNALFGPALALLAAVWGGKLLFSLLWLRSSRRDPSDSEG